MRLTALVLTAAAMLPSARGDLIAWSGDQCNGAQGRDVLCGRGDCFSFVGRHSMAATLPNRCVSMWTGTGCVGQRFNFTNVGTSCLNINTGTNIQSFRCWGGASSCR
ncbi:hypothetical protein AURDEDRAFT_162145 [Auricularia subglabra TFB-10046 SS5]|nr:hypothetical protein AURDEDRAFT_162145 [Auricularia subglabra TFB-10046 SS5]